mmetsp:Transcript_36439/g.120691  ORF Transcript_36439/g.120691 Transcript_36439/m.120691 type:complete len:207 (+) Transcript_36439:751-1371(+)
MQPAVPKSWPVGLREAGPVGERVVVGDDVLQEARRLEPTIRDPYHYCRPGQPRRSAHRLLRVDVLVHEEARLLRRPLELLADPMEGLRAVRHDNVDRRLACPGRHIVLAIRGQPSHAPAAARRGLRYRLLEGACDCAVAVRPLRQRDSRRLLEPAAPILLVHQRTTTRRAEAGVLTGLQCRVADVAEHTRVRVLWDAFEARALGGA